MKNKRIENVLKAMSKKDLTQLVVTDSKAIYYLTGKEIHPGERFLALYIRTDGEHKIFLNNLFSVTEDLGIEKVWYSDIEDGVANLAKYTDKTATLGVDKTMVAKFLLRLIELNAGSAYIDGSFAVDTVRACKDEEERARMRIASQINDKAMDKIIALISPGMTENAIANQIKDIYLSLGADDISFTPICGFGANASDSHHEPDDTIIKEGDNVVIDVGCKKDDYCSDMTRTVFFKSATEKAKKVYELVKSANEAAEAMIKPGVRFCDIDKAARDIIENAGYGVEFNHRTGHSIGMDVHEYGDVSSANKDIVEEGMIFSIEPGIYIEGEIGVRIEDLVLVTKTGCEVLNKYSKDLFIVE